MTQALVEQLIYMSSEICVFLLGMHQYPNSNFPIFELSQELQLS
jgi:hypothetical protein